MSDCWINIRIGTRHLQVGKWLSRFSFSVNPYHVENKPETLIEVFEFFGYQP